ncbi:MAG: shikimate dehydrogenase [Oscillospiraceae bacterium]|nr:shikimate dehydrogenase [Oscillospiraceae bacterium]MBO7423947.1 shikimate dehydrogenase [Oscillospiraceae bacterium]MBO7728288.1 shikimate dehydrogenase [Oscillospiraceae bacterium]
MSKSYRSQLVGCFGNPVDENPTGVMEEAAFREKGLDFRYLTVLVRKEDLGKAMDGVRAFNMRGVNLTIPHKVRVLQYLDDLSEAARITGAVNMVVNNDGKLWGENTDGKGFLISLQKEGIDVSGKRVVVLGAGGAARAISVECALAGAERITIINRNPQRGEELVSLINSKTKASAQFLPWVDGVDVPEKTDILANATSVGLFPNTDCKPDICYDTITDRMVVTDVIFNDPNSLFLGEAKARGAKTVNGLGMLVEQGALNFKLWTGVDAPVELMTEVLRKEFNL